MSLRRRNGIGWEVVCDAIGCHQTTAQWGPISYRKSSDLALKAARMLAWVTVEIAGETRWVCAMHQTFDLRLGRWVATPLITEPNRRRPHARHAS